MSPVKKRFALVLESGRMVFFEQTKQKWQLVPLQGERGWRSYTEMGNGPSTHLYLLNERINSEQQLATCDFLVLCAADAYPEITALAKTFEELQCRQWHLLPLAQFLPAAMAIQRGESNDAQWLQEILLPVTNQRLHEALVEEDVTHQLALSQKESDLAQLQREIVKLQREKREIRASLTSILQPDTDLLLCFLPAIYEKFWATISPSDFALLTGVPTIPNIPSPFPEPSADTVLTLKKRFIDLPVAEKEKIIGWCHNLSHALKIRTAFRELISNESI